MKMKICGIRRMEDIDILNKYRPACAGFILDYPASSRYIPESLLTRLVSRLDASIQKIGVFVHPDSDCMIRLVQKGLIDIIQLHQPENPDLIRLLQSHGIPVIQVFEKPDAAALLQAAACQADMILLDAGKGSGQKLQLDALHSLSRPFILAGGIDPDTLDLLRLPDAVWMLDVSSGVEINGCKDAALIAQLMQAAARLNLPRSAI